MKTIVAIILTMFYFIIPLMAQIPEIELIAERDSIKDEMPSFPGGSEEMYKYLFHQLQYPQQAKLKGIQGTVIVKFIVGKEGEVRDIYVEKGIGYGCDEEVVRVVTLMKDEFRWTPGKHDGNPVDVNFTLPMKFSLH